MLASVCRNLVHVERMLNDPLSFKGGLRIGWAAASLEAMDEANQCAADFKPPLLVMYGTHDRVVLPVAVHKFFTNVGSADKRVKKYDGLYHELYNEPERAQVISDVVAWLSDRITWVAQRVG